jgi:hypothetical protein
MSTRNSTLPSRALIRKGFLAAAAATAVVAGSLSNARASTTLFSDNFNVTTPTPTTNPLDYNYNLPVREGGTLGSGGAIAWDGPNGTTGPYVVGNGSGNGVQVGNGGTGDLPANSMLIAFGNIASPNYNFNNTSYGPLTISFQLNPNPTAQSNSTYWGAISIGLDSADQLAFVNAGNSNDFAVLFRSNGGYQAFQGGSVVSASSGAYWDGGNGKSFHTHFHTFQLVITGQNGTGSGFTGNGTEIQLFADGTQFAQFSTAAGGGLSSALGQNNYINFGSTQGGDIIGIDNLQITSSASATPEPTSLALLGIAGVGTLCLARRRA